MTKTRSGPHQPAGRAGSRILLLRGAAATRLAWQASWPATLASVVLALALGCAPVLTAWVTRLVINELARGAGTRNPVNKGTLLVLAAGIAVVGLAQVSTPHLSRYAQAQLRRALALHMQDRLFAAINAMPGLRQFESPEFHDRLRLAREAGQTAPTQTVGSGLAMGQNVITMAGFFTALIALSPVMALIVAAAILPSIGVQLSLSRRQARVMWEISPAMRRQIFYGMLLTGTSAAKEVRVFGLGSFLRSRMRRELLAVNAAERAVDTRMLRSQGMLAVLGAVVSGGGLIWAVLRAAGGALTIGDLTLFIAGLGGVQSALATVARQIAQAHLSLLMLGNYFDLIQAAPDLPVPANPAKLPPLRRGIELRGVWFRYADDHPWTLRGVDLFLPAGRSAGLVGLNGAGKSTLVKLMCRLYDPQRGSIRWDGVDLRDVDPADLRKRIGAVFQDYMCYELTATDNIGMGDLDALEDPERIKLAAGLAGIDRRLSELPRGYATMLSRIFADRDGDGQTGVTLSGGEWQRVALARGFLRGRRDLLILDEPSSGLDPQAEHDVHTRMRRHRAGRTSLLISHRLGAVRDADQIVVLSDGRITEKGTHTELMAAGGEYARMFRMQASGYNADNPATPGPDSAGMKVTRSGQAPNYDAKKQIHGQVTPGP